jgi:hypothetical protein
MNQKKTIFMHALDGEWAQCRKCALKGYGDDSFHPFTTEFFPMLHGKMRTDQCRACQSEAQKGTKGMVAANDASFRRMAA